MFQSILQFWFEELTPQAWFKVDSELDALIQTRFGGLHQRALQGELFDWRQSAQGRLAEIIVLDQFSRNMYRGTAQAFAQDPMALALAQEAVAGGNNLALTQQEQVFLYLPYMHSESKVVHIEAEKLFQKLGLESNYTYELQHKTIVDRFGRYPHRNAILGRESTPEEAEFLTQPGSGF